MDKHPSRVVLNYYEMNHQLKFKKDKKTSEVMGRKGSKPPKSTQTLSSPHRTSQKSGTTDPKLRCVDGSSSV